MYPEYRRRGQNPVERTMRPGVLVMSLLIAFAIIFLLTPSSEAPMAVADGSEETTAPARNADADDSAADERAAYDETDDRSTYDDDPVDDNPVEDDGELADRTERSIEGGEDYDDEGIGSGEGYDDVDPRPGDDEEDVEVAVEEEDESADESSEGRHRECIYVRAINDYRVIDDRHLTVSTSPRRLYLVTLWNRCYDLKWSHQIAIKAYSSWTCSHSRDYIITEENRCIIDNIERVSSFEEAVDLVAERTGDDAE